MLEGITVLNQSEIMKLVDWFWPSMIIGMILMIIFLSVGVIYLDKWWGLILAIISGIITACLLILVGVSPEEPSGRYQYECTIDESVSMTEVYERYEIIEQRGDIWVLEDKE